jgi:hypothetical protein
MLVRFDPTKGTNTSVALTGLATSEVHRFSLRPANGVFAISIKADCFQ